MKKLLIVSLVLAFALPALAGPTVKYLGRDAGAFKLQLTSGNLGNLAVGETFLTYCLESNERIIYGVSFDVYDISYAADAGGAGGPSPDPVSQETNFIYNEFEIGNLNGIDRYQVSRAIYALEDEITLKNDGTDDVAKQLVADAQTAVMGGWSTTNIYAINLAFLNDTTLPDGTFFPAGSLAQSFLIRVPAPGALLLGSLGATLVGWLRRRRSI